jgi:hypothetical protein
MIVMVEVFLQAVSNAVSSKSVFLNRRAAAQ